MALQAQADRPYLQGRRARAWELLTLGAQIPGDVARQVTVAQARSGLCRVRHRSASPGDADF